MANQLYTLGKVKLWTGGINLESADVKVVFLDGDDYTPNIDEDEFYSDVSAAAVGTPTSLQGKEVTADAQNSRAIFSADNVVLESVTGYPAEYILLFADTGNAATSPLIALIDTAQWLTTTPNGNGITISWDASGIFYY